MPQKSQKPRNKRMTSDPTTGVPNPQPTRPPSRAGAPEYPGSSSTPQQNPDERGRKPTGRYYRKTSGPPAVTSRPQRKRATSRSSAHEQDPTLQQSPPRPRVNCRYWLKGDCPQGPKCFFTHDPEVWCSLYSPVCCCVDIRISRREQRKNSV